MIQRSFLFISLIVLLLITGCVKESYDMNLLSKEMHLSPTWAMSAIRGNILFSDMVKSGDTVIYDEKNFVKIVFKKESFINLKFADFFPVKNMINDAGKNNGQLAFYPPYQSSDFLKGAGQLVATIEQDTLNLDLGDILSMITGGEIQFANPSIKLYYSNSFAVPVKIKLNAIGKRKDKPQVSLGLDTLTLLIPNYPVQQDVSDIFNINTNNSNLQKLLSLPPEEISFSGSAVLDPAAINIMTMYNTLNSSRIEGRLEIELPLELRMINLQFADTLDNFLKDNSSGDNPVKPENFELLRVDFNAKNGFPLGVSLKMSLYDSLADSTISTIEAIDILKPAPVDGNGKVNGVSETKTHLEFTKQFFSSISNADKIIFNFALNTTGSQANDIKIYSDYRIDFNSALVVKPDIKLK